ncbi:MAG: DUF2142 domain-containing protein [Lewinellaceae bacterium]|nr:DUF2142 domain-containing protein [Lewinellaceae bacterium]
MTPAGLAKLWAGLALLFGTVFVFTIPPFQSPDEPNHFLRAWQLSEGVWMPEMSDNRLGGTVPASLVQLRDSFAYLKMDYEARLTLPQLETAHHLALSGHQRVFADFPNTAIYAPTAYLPQAAGIGLCRLAGAGPLAMLYGARFANLVVWILLVWRALLLMPFLRPLLAALALLPASLVIAASANADVITNGLCWWLIASFLAGMGKYHLQIAAFILVCLHKLIVLPIALFSFISNAKRVGRNLLPAVLLLVVGFAAALFWGQFARAAFIPYDHYAPAYRDAQTLNEGVDPERQLARVATHPFEFTGIALRSAARALPSTAAHIVGKFGWEKNYLHPVWLALLWLCLAALVSTESPPLGPFQRAAAGGIVAVYVFLFALTMYALWCPVGAAEVTNFQGRYFTPILPLVMLAVANGRLAAKAKVIRICAATVLILGNLAMIAAIMQRYYW